jgi:hypothetical protein
MIATEAPAGFSCGKPSLLLLSACIEGYDLGIGVYHWKILEERAK